jgi:hypothetical protein
MDVQIVFLSTTSIVWTPFAIRTLFVHAGLFGTPVNLLPELKISRCRNQ